MGVQSFLGSLSNMIFATLVSVLLLSSGANTHRPTAQDKPLDFLNKNVWACHLYGGTSVCQEDPSPLPTCDIYMDGYQEFWYYMELGFQYCVCCRRITIVKN